MRVWNNHRRQQLIYIAADAMSSIVVWLLFLLFRWMVYEGKVFGVDTVLIPAFDFYPPLVLYPLGCLVVYYLSGYYLRPFRKSYSRELLTTLCSSVVITLGAFFAIIIDDPVTSYHRYLTSLLVLFGLQFVVSYVPRRVVTQVSQKRRSNEWRCYTIHSVEEVEAFKQLQAESPQDEVIIDLNGDANERDIYTIINRIYPYNTEIAIVPRLYDMLMGAASIQEVGDIPLVRITEHKMSDAGLCIKRACDVAFSAAGMLLLSPLYVAVAIAVKCSSEGPVIYKQERVGLHGVPFNILKFRTMKHNAEPTIPLLSADDDPRITRVGRILRKYRIDELPQLWNVLRGDMSIVGPRPERRYFIHQIEEKAPYYSLLYKIRPGLTSWGPIKVGYTDTMDKMVRRLNYDIVYMENMSLLLDLKILFFTVGVVLDGKGK